MMKQWTWFCIAASLAGCLAEPTHGEIVASRTSEVDVLGYTTTPGERIRIYARQPGSTSSSYLGDVRASTSPTNTGALNFYGFRRDVTVPSHRWKAGEAGWQTELFAVRESGTRLITFDSDQRDCVLNDIDNPVAGPLCSDRDVAVVCTEDFERFDERRSECRPARAEIERFQDGTHPIRRGQHDSAELGFVNINGKIRITGEARDVRFRGDDYTELEVWSGEILSPGERISNPFSYMQPGTENVGVAFRNTVADRNSETYHTVDVKAGARSVGLSPFDEVLNGEAPPDQPLWRGGPNRHHRGCRRMLDSAAMGFPARRV